jgi:hypothetical protein
MHTCELLWWLFKRAGTSSAYLEPADVGVVCCNNCSVMRHMSFCDQAENLCAQTAHDLMQKD